MNLQITSLANKYRPQTFNDLIEQSHISDILKQQIIKGHSHSNYIFFWPRGTGKTTTARIFAKALNCPHTHEGNPCGTCEICTSISEWSSMDVIEIDAASHTGVDNIREEIIGKASYPPSSLQRKVYIIDEVHMLSKGAFNALLKIMEEPPAYLTFILATTEIQKVPETIVSRCQVFQFKKLTYPSIVQQLSRICDREWFTYDIEALQLIAELSEWCDRDAIKYVDQVSMFWDINIKAVSSLLGIVSQHVIQQRISLHQTKNLNDIITYIQQLSESWVDLTIFINQLLGYIDRHFMEDPIFYSEIVEISKRILSSIKILPQALLAYKIEYYRIYADTNQSKHTINIWQSTSISDTITTHNTSPIKSSKSSTITPAPASTTDLLDDLLVESANSSPESSDPMTTLFHQLTGRINKLSTKTMLTQYWLMDRIEDGVAHIVLFNPIALSALNKPDIQADIEWHLSDITTSSIKVSYTVTTKEQYAIHQLGL